MPLTFVDKKKHWPPSKPVQYLLATLALLIAVAVLIVGLSIGIGCIVAVQKKYNKGIF